jgi:hypothetical protein
VRHSSRSAKQLRNSNVRKFLNSVSSNHSSAPQLRLSGNYNRSSVRHPRNRSAQHPRRSARRLRNRSAKLHRHSVKRRRSNVRLHHNRARHHHSAKQRRNVRRRSKVPNRSRALVSSQPMRNYSAVNTRIAIRFRTHRAGRFSPVATSLSGPSSARAFPSCVSATITVASCTSGVTSATE